MFESILRLTRSKYKSLLFFYEKEYDRTLEDVKEGQKKYQIGFICNYYLCSLLVNDGKEKNQNLYDKIEKTADRYLEDIEIKRDTNNEAIGISYRIKESSLSKINIDKDAYMFRTVTELPNVLGNSILVMIITYFESFLSDYFYDLFLAYPDKYIMKKDIKLSLCPNIETISDLKSFIAKREVGLTLRGSLDDWLKIIESHGVCLEKYDDLLIKPLREIYARRNIVVHNENIVNEDYCHIIKNTNNIIGTQLNVDAIYLKTSIQIIESLMFIILILSSKFIDDEEKRQKYLLNVFDQAFEELQDGNYFISSIVFGDLRDNSLLTQDVQKMALINYWNSKILSNKENEIIDEINNFDVSSLDVKYDMAKTVLLKDYDKTSIILRKMLKEEKIRPVDIETWPLFIRYRDTQEYSVLKESYPGFNIHYSEKREDNDVCINGNKNEILAQIKA